MEAAHSSECDCKIDVGVNVFRVVLDGSPKHHLGFDMPPLLGEQDPQVVARAGQLRIRFDRGIQGHLGFRESRSLSECHSELVERPGHLRIRRQRSFKGPDPFLLIPEPGMCQGSSVVILSVLGPVGQRSAVLPEGSLGLTPLEIPATPRRRTSGQFFLSRSFLALFEQGGLGRQGLFVPNFAKYNNQLEPCLLRPGIQFAGVPQLLTGFFQLPFPREDCPEFSAGIRMFGLERNRPTERVLSLRKTGSPLQGDAAKILHLEPVDTCWQRFLPFGDKVQRSLMAAEVHRAFRGGESRVMIAGSEPKGVLELVHGFGEPLGLRESSRQIEPANEVIRGSCDKAVQNFDRGFVGSVS